jgi:hypothetical protein
VITKITDWCSLAVKVVTEITIIGTIIGLPIVEREEIHNHHHHGGVINPLLV